MKRTFLRILPVAAALLLATSCSKDSDNDTSVATTPGNNLPAQEQVVEQLKSQAIPFSITVGKDGSSLSKSTVEYVDGTGYVQKFIAGDVLVISNSEVLQEDATLSLKSGDENKTSATFEGELKVKDGVELVKGTTTFDAVLKNDSKQNSGTAVDGVKEASSLAEAFEKYGYLTADDFTYNGSETKITLVQNTVFLKIKPYKGQTTATVNGTLYTAAGGGVIYLAVKSGTEITSNLFSGTKTVTNENGKVVKNIDRSDVSEGALDGVFSVSDTKTVKFSKGNLQATYDGSSWEWGFAANQWDYIGGAAANTKISGNGTVSENGTVDLFGWVGSSSTVLTSDPAMYGISSSTTTSEYGNLWEDVLKSDWGTKIGDGKTWQTLSTSEWQYLFNSRANNNMLYGHGKITVDEKEICGLIILPDSWTLPTGLEFTSGKSEWVNSYTTDQWAQMESAGAVFLPAAGYRNGSEVSNAGSYGWYWSSTADLSYYAGRVRFTSSDVHPAHHYSGRENGFSVRLVCPL